MRLPNSKPLLQVKLIGIILPIILFTIVIFYEGNEHLLDNGKLEISFNDVHFNFEVLFFGILGPLAVFIAVSYIESLLKKQLIDQSRLETLNRSLEQKVAERTKELKGRNEELARANRQLQEVDELKSDFIALVSHELRGPLTTLNGGLELALQNAASLPPESRRVLEVMTLESQRLTNFVKSILDVSRLEAGKMTPMTGPVAVLPLLKRTVEVVFAGKSRQIYWGVPVDLPPVWADEVFLEEILSNLLRNAEIYSPPDKPIEISAQLNGGTLRISVIDHGPGIPPEMQNKIFERFNRLEHGDRITSQGWGLGLYLARSLAEALDGKLVLTSPFYDDEKFPGTAFTVTIPIDEEVPADA